MKEILPVKQEAVNLLSWGQEQNPGPWTEHSKVVARAAEKIARQCGMDDNKAYILGLLHDIGRYEVKEGFRHIYTGYKLLEEKGYNYNARICVTHSFPVKDMDSTTIFNDCTKEEIDIIEMKLNEYEYDDYDKLIQLCDSMCMAGGVCLMETRLVETARRHKAFGPKILYKWNAYFELKQYFDKKCNMSIYSLFYDEIIGNSIK